MVVFGIFWVVELCVVCVHSGWGWSCDGVSRPLFTPLAGLSSFFSGLLPRNSPFCARVPPSLVVGSARVGGGGFVFVLGALRCQNVPFRLFRAFSPFSPLLYFGIEIKKIKEDQSKQKIG